MRVSHRKVKHSCPGSAARRWEDPLPTSHPCPHCLLKEGRGRSSRAQGANTACRALAVPSQGLQGQTERVSTSAYSACSDVISVSVHALKNSCRGGLRIRSFLQLLFLFLPLPTVSLFPSIFFKKVVKGVLEVSLPYYRETVQHFKYLP